MGACKDCAFAKDHFTHDADGQTFRCARITCDERPTDTEPSIFTQPPGDKGSHLIVGPDFGCTLFDSPEF